MRDNVPEIITIIAMVLIVAVFLFFLMQISAEHDNKLWNDGHCDICGGTWEYEQAVGHKSSTSYIYICRKCGKRIEISEIRQEITVEE